MIRASGPFQNAFYFEREGNQIYFEGNQITLRYTFESYLYLNRVNVEILVTEEHPIINLP